MALPANPSFCLLSKLLASRQIEYLIIDANWQILERSAGAARLAEVPEAVDRGQDIRLSFGELVGAEASLQAVLHQQQPAFELKTIARSTLPHTLLYVDLYVLAHTAIGYFANILIVLVEDVTPRVSLEQCLVQSAHEANLLLSSLAASTAYINQIVTSIADALFVTTATGIVKQVNQAAQSLFGYSEAELVGQPIAQLAMNQTVFSQIKQTLLTTQLPALQDIEVVCRTKDQLHLLVAFSCSMLQISPEEPQSFVYIGRDVTERKQAEQRLIAEHATSRILTESVTLEIDMPRILRSICESLDWHFSEFWTIDATAQRLHCTATWCRAVEDYATFYATTQSRTFSLGAGLPGTVWARGKPVWIKDVVQDPLCLRSAAAAADRLHGAIGFPILNGSEVLGVITMFHHQVQLPNVELQRMMNSIGRQIGQFVKRKQAEQALQQNEQQLRLALEGSGDGLWDWNIATGEIYLSPQWLGMLGYGAEELPSDLSTWEALLHPDDKPKVLDCLQSHLHNATVSCKFDYRLRTKTGDWKWIADYGKVVVWDAAGKPLRMAGIHRDIDDRKQAEQALHQREQAFRALAENAPDIIARFDRSLRMLYVNPAIAAKTEMLPAALMGKTPEEIGASESLELLWQKVKQAFETGQPQAVDFELMSPTQTTEFYSSRVVPELSSSGAVATVLVVTRDITALKQIEQALFQEKELAQVTLHSIGDAVVTTDAAGKIEYFNPIAEALTGWQQQEAQGLPLATVVQIVHETTREPVVNPVEQALQQQQIVELANHSVLIARDGREIAIEDSAAPIRDRNGQILGAVMVFHDVTQTRSLSHQLSWQASHDPLTGLANRREFEQRLEQALQKAKTQATEHVLCYLDLDQFKIVNDSCGHAAGDELLRQITALLQVQVRKSDTLARLGGDEFGLLLYQCSLPQAERIANVLREAVQDFRFAYQSQLFAIGVSIGIVGINAESESLAQILSAADTACYAAKRRGRNRVQVMPATRPELQQQQAESHWVTEIMQALENDRFCLYGQTIAALSAPQANHCEVLLRLRDHQGELISPMTFIPAAERYNLMHLIDRWVIRTFFQHWASLNPLHCFYAINLSGASLNDDQFIPFLYEQLMLHKIPPQQICFEVAETTAIVNLARVRQLICELQRLGCCFGLDNFGCGMASLTYLKKLPIDYLKIDGSLIQNILQDEFDGAIVEAIVRICQVKQVQTVAKFIENSALLDRIQALGIDYAQGYEIARPIPLL